MSLGGTIIPGMSQAKVGLGLAVKINKTTKLADAAKMGETATIYRNFGWNELSSIKNTGGNFSIHPN